MENTKYIHGYSKREALRLNDQADTLDNIIRCSNCDFFKVKRNGKIQIRKA